MAVVPLDLTALPGTGQEQAAAQSVDACLALACTCVSCGPPGFATDTNERTSNTF